MRDGFQRRPWVARTLAFLQDERAAQIVEFAVSLPLLMVFVVGIFDFSGAYTIKNKLTNAAKEAARVAAADPANDLEDTLPVSVTDAFQAAHNYMLANNLNDCGIASSAPKSGLTWTFSETSAVASSNGCPTGGLTIIVNRGYIFQTGSAAPTNCASGGAPPAGQTAFIGTCVNVQYAYKWRFNRIIGVLVSGATYPGITVLTTSAVAFNEN